MSSSTSIANAAAPSGVGCGVQPWENTQGGTWAPDTAQGMDKKERGLIVYRADGDTQHSLITVPAKLWLTWSCDVSGMLGQQEEIPLSEWWVSLQSCSQSLCKAMVVREGPW